jgi:hypothetical protein
MQGKTAFRMATLAGLLDLGFEWLRLVRFAYEHPGAGGESGSVNVELAVVGLVALITVVTALWIWGFDVLRVLIALVGSLLSWRVADESWGAAVGRSIARLPYAALAGAATWIIYSAGRFGGWPGDVVFGAVAWLLGAWSAWPLLRAIIVGRREAKISSHGAVAEGESP